MWHRVYLQFQLNPHFTPPAVELKFQGIDTKQLIEQLKSLFDHCQNLREISVYHGVEFEMYTTLAYKNGQFEISEPKSVR